MFFNELPAINFATADPAEVELEVVGNVENILGRTLERADPLRIFLRGVELSFIHQRLLLDQTAKMNLLAYAKDDFLDHIGAFFDCQRLSAAKAVTTVEITLSAARQVSTTILKQTRITAGDDVYFELDEDVIFLAGETVKQIKATCTVTGEVGNGYAAGEINRIVDPQPFLLSIVNVTTSEGGADIEDNDNYRERIHEAPEAFSCAGSEGAYRYHAKSVSALISDVAVYSDRDHAGEVFVYVLLKGGTLPGDEMLQAVFDYLSAKTVRPLTDHVIVSAPVIVYYDLDVTYWISQSKAAVASLIQSKATAAVNDYIEWQRDALGRDINPSELIYLLKATGVKRVEVANPEFTATNNFTVALPNNINITFAGLEDD